ncbi:MAG: response regulator [Actinomycetota bacterium]
MLIVLADKNPYDLQALQAGLVADDREVIIVPDGENITTLCFERSPDVIVVGSSLGKMGGFAVCRDLKQQAAQGRIKRMPKIVILLEREADSWIAKKVGADAHLVKPIDVAALDSLVADLVGQAV